MKRICHIDLNAFFCQCEILLDSSLKGKAIAVGNFAKRGVISTSSYEARKKGVYSAMSCYEAKNICPELILVTPHFGLYEEKSNQFFSYLQNRFPVLEKASIDECYIDLTEALSSSNNRNDENDFLFDLQMDLFRHTSLKCSIGLSYNKFLAKMASDMKKPLGITIIHPGDIEKMIHPLPISSFFGIGKKTAPLLMENGIQTIGDLANSEDERVKKILGSSFRFFKNEANGIGDDFVDCSSFDPKSISSERTFLDDVTSYEEISAMILNCTKEAVQELKKYHKEALTISLKLRNAQFVTKSKRMTLVHPSDDQATLYSSFMKIFDSFYHDEPLRLIGVSIEKVREREKKEKEKIITDINAKLKKGGRVFAMEDLKK